MKPKQAGALPEKTGYTKYFEHDGALRAYANRMMWFGISAVLISFVLALLLFYVRVQPPTVIRIAAERSGHGGERRDHNAADAAGLHGRPGRLFGSRRATCRHRGSRGGAQVPGKLPHVHAHDHGEELGRRVKYDDA